MYICSRRCRGLFDIPCMPWSCIPRTRTWPLILPRRERKSSFLRIGTFWGPCSSYRGQFCASASCPSSRRNSCRLWWHQVGGSDYWNLSPDFRPSNYWILIRHSKGCSVASPIVSGLRRCICDQCFGQGLASFQCPPSQYRSKKRLSEFRNCLKSGNWSSILLVHPENCSLKTEAGSAHQCTNFGRGWGHRQGVFQRYLPKLCPESAT